ncbi:MAG: efflux transporter outer membrane subunit [Magnetococcales bacterium]|nr:efflux transporter outer membrane subunit [Magnetococcales bacterium]
MGNPTRSGLPAVLILLASCSFLPTFERPAAPVAEQWPVAAAPGRAAGLSWRQVLPDARLQALIQAALEHNRDLRITIGRVAEARALYRISDAEQRPTLNLGLSQSATRTPDDLSSTGRSAISRRLDVELGVTAFELDFWGRVQSLSAAAQAGYLATEQAREAFRLSLIADVASAHLALLDFDERLPLARELLDNRRQKQALIQRRRAVGLATGLEDQAAAVAVEAARLQVIDLERNRQQADQALTLLVGTRPPDLPAGRSLAGQDIQVDLAVAAPAEVLLNRPDVQAAEQRLRAANANIGAARAAFLPRVGLSLALGTAGKSLAGLFDAGSGAWSFAPTLVQPLFDAGSNQATLDLAEARQVVAVAEYEKTLQQAFREVADLLIARDRLAAQLQTQESLERSQHDRLRLVTARARAGVGNRLDLLDAQYEVTTATQGTLTLRRALLATAGQLYEALGGDGG